MLQKRDAQTFCQKKTLPKSFHPTVQPFFATFSKIFFKNLRKFFPLLTNFLPIWNATSEKYAPRCLDSTCPIWKTSIWKSTHFHKPFSKTSWNWPICSNFLPKWNATSEKFLSHCLESTCPKGKFLPWEKEIPPSFTNLLPKLNATSDFFFSHYGCCPNLQLCKSNFVSKFEQNRFMRSAVNPLWSFGKVALLGKIWPFFRLFLWKKVATFTR